MAGYLLSRRNTGEGRKRGGFQIHRQSYHLNGLTCRVVRNQQGMALVLVMLITMALMALGVASYIMSANRHGRLVAGRHFAPNKGHYREALGAPSSEFSWSARAPNALKPGYSGGKAPFSKKWLANSVFVSILTSMLG